MITYNSETLPRSDIFMFTRYYFYWPENIYSLYKGGYENPLSITDKMVTIGPKVLTEWRDEEV